MKQKVKSKGYYATMKRKMSFLLILLMLCNTSIVNAKEDVYGRVHHNNTNLTEEFYNATDDTIVCYMDGVAITKSQVDENGMVDLEQKNYSKAQNYSLNNGLTRAAKQSTIFYATDSIPLGITYPCSLFVAPYNNAVIKTTITAPRYSQENVKMYLSSSEAAKFASTLDTTTGSTVLFTAAGFIPKVGPVITIAFAVASIRNAEVASKIRSYTNYGKRVRVNVATSNFMELFMESVSGLIIWRRWLK